MNDAARAAIFRNPEAETPDKWVLLKDAVDNVRPDLLATNSNRMGQPGKWTVRATELFSRQAAEASFTVK